MGIIEKIQAEQIAKWSGAEEGKEGKKHPDFRTGDTLKVHVRIKEGEKERIQIFQGVCIKTRHGSAHNTFTVRKMSSGIGVLSYITLDNLEVRRLVLKTATLFVVRTRLALRLKSKRLRSSVSPALLGSAFLPHSRLYG